MNTNKTKKTFLFFCCCCAPNFYGGAIYVTFDSSEYVLCWDVLQHLQQLLQSVAALVVVALKKTTQTVHTRGQPCW